MRLLDSASHFHSHTGRLLCRRLTPPRRNGQIRVRHVYEAPAGQERPDSPKGYQKARSHAVTWARLDGTAQGSRTGDFAVAGAPGHFRHHCGPGKPPASQQQAKLLPALAQTALQRRCHQAGSGDLVPDADAAWADFLDRLLRGSPATLQSGCNASPPESLPLMPHTCRCS